MKKYGIASFKGTGKEFRAYINQLKLIAGNELAGKATIRKAVKA